MRIATAALLLAGLALLGLVVAQTDLAEAWSLLGRIGAPGVAAVAVVFLVSTIFQTLSWHLTLPSATAGVRWLRELWMLVWVGDALNIVTPVASVGGEPLKVLLLNKRHGIGFQEATASLILQLTVQNLGLIPFLLVGLALMPGIEALPPAYAGATAVALALFTAGIAGFFLLQHNKLVSRMGGWLVANGIGERLSRLLALVHEFEGRLVHFYRGRRRRFAAVMALEFAIWALTAVEIYVVLYFLGHPPAWSEAWVIAATIALVHAALFFVPGNIGTQEAAIVVVGGIIVGSAALALALALIIRLREIVWVAGGLALGLLFLGESRAAHGEPKSAERPQDLSRR
jgi:glycosyltransferase 2 family protein